MPIKEFTDPDGVSWRVWATNPTRGNVRPHFAAGWLTFESADERRRLAPVPAGWEDASDGACLEMLAHATAVAPADLTLPPPAGGAAEGGAAPAPGVTGLETTLARVRAVIRAVDDALHRRPAG